MHRQVSDIEKAACVKRVVAVAATTLQRESDDVCDGGMNSCSSHQLLCYWKLDSRYG
jgi:hypothetical protein